MLVLYNQLLFLRVVCIAKGHVSLVPLVMVVAYIWKQSVGQPCLISESWANVDGLQKCFLFFIVSLES